MHSRDLVVVEAIHATSQLVLQPYLHAPAKFALVLAGGVDSR